jgi:ankyrin repeat protein
MNRIIQTYDLIKLNCRSLYIPIRIMSVTPLCASIINGKIEATKLLLECGACPIKIGQGGLPMQWAVKQNNIDTIELLIGYGADVNDLNDGRGSSMHTAVVNNNIDMVKWLLDNGARIDHMGTTMALSTAAAKNNFPIVNLLLSRGIDVNAHSGKFMSALRAATLFGHDDMATMLIGIGAKPGLGIQGDTPL